MNNYNISIDQIATTEVHIVNINPPVDEQLHININRNIRKLDGDSFSCVLTASIYREQNKDDKDYHIKYAIKAIATCASSNITPEEIQDSVTKELYPHLRAGLAGVMGSAGIAPIYLPNITM